MSARLSFTYLRQREANSDVDRDSIAAAEDLAAGEAAEDQADGNEEARLHRMPQRVAEDGEQDRSRQDANRARPEVVAKLDWRRAGQQIERVVGNYRAHPQ